MTKKLSWYRGFHPWMFLLPTVLGLLVFRLGPIAATFVLSFARWDLLAPLRWVGLENFGELFHNRDSLLVLNNTLLFSLFYSLGVGTVGLGLALLLNCRGLRGKHFFRMVFYPPVVTSAVAVGIVWFWILSPEYGILDLLLRSMRPNIVLPYWLGDRRWALFSVGFIQVWKMCGYYMLLYLGGLQHIPASIREAAIVDGAGPASRFFRITWPLLSSTTFFVLIISIIDSFKNFEMIYTLTKGGPNNASNTISYDIYVYSFVHNRLGYASSEALILLFVVALVTAWNFALKKRWVHYFDD